MDRPWRLVRKEGAVWTLIQPRLYLFATAREAENLAARYRTVDAHHDYRAAKMGAEGILCAIAPKRLLRCK